MFSSLAVFRCFAGPSGLVLGNKRFNLFECPANGHGLSVVRGLPSWPKLLQNHSLKQFFL